MRVDVIDKDNARYMVTAYHYLGSKGFRFGRAYGLWSDDGQLKGAAVFHSPSAPETVVGAFGLTRTDQAGIWELGRFVLTPDTNGGNWGSFLLGRAIRHLRRTNTVRAIITYADSTYHVGALYQATNFIYCGLTTKKKDFYVDGIIKERGKTKGIEGEWRDRPQKHRYVLVFDKDIKLKWAVQSYVKKDSRKEVLKLS